MKAERSWWFLESLQQAWSFKWQHTMTTHMGDDDAHTRRWFTCGLWLIQWWFISDDDSQTATMTHKVDDDSQSRQWLTKSTMTHKVDDDSQSRRWLTKVKWLKRRRCLLTNEHKHFCSGHFSIITSGKESSIVPANWQRRPYHWLSGCSKAWCRTAYEQLRFSIGSVFKVVATLVCVHFTQLILACILQRNLKMLSKLSYHLLHHKANGRYLAYSC